MPRSDITMVTWCSASGRSDQKSQVIVGRAQTRARIALDRVVQVRKAQRIAKEEDGCIVADDVPVAFLGIEFHGECRGYRVRHPPQPRSPATVDMRINIGVCLPTSEKIFALV